MVSALASLGIPKEKIRVIFNRVDSDVDEEFRFVVNHHKKENNFTLNKKCSIFENELFDALSIKGLTVDALLSDQTDYKSLLKNNKDASEAERNAWSDMFVLKSLAKGVKRNLDYVYEHLFKD